MRQLVERCEKQVGSPKDLLVLDVGCNDGSLLSIFRERGARTVGVEPTGAAADAKQAGHTVYQDYFAPSLAEKIAASGGLPDIITFTNVFAHIEDLRSVLSAVGALMGPNTLLVIENHYLGSVLDRYQFDTFYHEHPRTYSLTSFRYIAKSLQARIEALEFPARYGGNIRVMMRRGDGKAQAAPELAQVDAAEGGFEPRLLDMAKRIPAWQKSKRAEIEAAVSRHGPLVGKAFPGRAAILVKLLDLDQSILQASLREAGLDEDPETTSRAPASRFSPTTTSTSARTGTCRFSIWPGTSPVKFTGTCASRDMTARSSTYFRQRSLSWPSAARDGNGFDG